MDQVPKDLFDLHFVMSDGDKSGTQAEGLFSVQASAEDQRQQLELLAQQQQSPVKVEDIPADFVIDHEEILTEIGVPKVLPPDYSSEYNSGAAISRVENTVVQPTQPELFDSQWKHENLTPPSTPDNIKAEDDGVQYVSTLPPMNMPSFQYYHSMMPQGVPVGYTLLPVHFAQPMFLPQYQQFATPFTQQEFHPGDYWQTQTVPTPDPSPTETLTPIASPLVSPIIPEPVKPYKNPSTFVTCDPVNAPVAHSATDPVELPIIVTQKRRTAKPTRKPLKARVHYDTGFYCAPCDRTFGRPSSFTQHNKIKHSGPRDHKCDICGKRYKLYEEMKEHEKRHLVATKEYACPACTKQFHHQKDLDRHYGLHHGLAPFSCKECGKGFGRADHLTAHMISHKNNTIKAPKKKGAVYGSS